MGSFTDKELKKYEKEIRYKPLPVLYRERKAVKNDPTPERQNIVKARIEALEDRERRINSVKEKEWQIAKQKAKQEIRNMTQPLPDKKGLVEFLAVTAFPFIILLFGNLSHHYRGFGYHSHGLIWRILWNSIFSEKSIKSLNFEPLLHIIKFLPIIGILLWFIYSYIKEIHPTKRPKDFDFIGIPSYWLLHFKTALSIASFFFFFSVEIFFSGKYNGLLYSDIGLPAYLIATGFFISSTLYIINAFFPINQKLRPKFGITLLAFAAALELIISNIFG